MKGSIAAAALLVAVTGSPVRAQTQGAPIAPLGDAFLSTQPADQWLGSFFAGEKVKNSAGETVGDVNNILFDKTGKITAIVIGVGGFLGIGEKEVAVPFEGVTIGKDKDGRRLVTLAVTKDALERAPAFAPIEKSMLTRAGESAKELGKKAGEKIEEFRKGEPANK